MRVAVFSDVHANYFALQGVLADAARQRVGSYWFLGDLVGYGPQPWPCLQGLKRMGSRLQCWLVGNHDLGLLRELTPYDFKPAPWFILEWTRAVLEAEGQWEEMQKALLGRKPYMRLLPSVWAIHGWFEVNEEGLQSSMDYIDRDWEDGFKVEDAWGWMCRNDPENPPRILLGGHVHLPLLWRRHEGDDPGQRGHWEETEPTGENGDTWEDCPCCQGRGCQGKRWNSPISLAGGPVLINPGSVGQPRDHCPMASYAILDLDRQEVTFRRVPYNIQAVQDVFRWFLFDHPAFDRDLDEELRERGRQLQNTRDRLQKDLEKTCRRLTQGE